jgi:hypothetical protein
MRSSLLALLVVALVGQGGCFKLTDWNVEETRSATFTLPFVASADLEGFDVLIVVDTSPSMLEASGRVADNGAMLAGMVDYNVSNAGLHLDSGPPLRIGVITPDLGAGGHPVGFCQGEGQRGALQNATDTEGGCPVLTDRWLNIEDGVATNLGYLPVAEAVACLVTGVQLAYLTSACGFEQPLAAVERALDATENAGFFRSGAGLAVVLMTEEDDCSAADPLLFDPAATELGAISNFRCFEHGLRCEEEGREPGARHGCRERTLAEGGLLRPTDVVATRLKQFKTGRPVVVAIASGPARDTADQPVTASVVLDGNLQPQVEPVCTSQGGLQATPAFRLAAFQSHFQNDGLFETICGQSTQLDELMVSLTDRIVANSVYRCLPEPLADMDPDAEGLQVECDVLDLVNPDQTTEDSTPVEDCAVVRNSDGTYSDPSCWTLERQAACTHAYQIVVRRKVKPAAGLITEATCQVMITE